jgi:OTU domain-containing protein 5
MLLLALLAEGRFYSDLELTEREIERMVMEASRAEYLAEENKLNIRESSTSGAEPSSSAASMPAFLYISRSLYSCLSSYFKLARSLIIVQLVGHLDRLQQQINGARTALYSQTLLTRSMQLLLAMGFSYIQVMEAYSIFGEDVDSMICYLVETGGPGASAGGSNRHKGKAAE